MAFLHETPECVCLSHVLVPSWRFIFRTTPVEADVLFPLSNLLWSQLVPSLLGWNPLDHDLRERVALPVRYAGLGLLDPLVMLETERRESDLLVQQVVDCLVISPPPPFSISASAAHKARRQRWERRDKVLKEQADRLLESYPPGRARTAFLEAMMPGGSTWLSRSPRTSINNHVSRQVFRDVVAMRFGVPPPDPLPNICPSCGDPANLDHLLSCKHGGFVNVRHNDVVNTWFSLSKSAGFVTDKEVPLPYNSPETSMSANDPDELEARIPGALEARPDLAIRGLLQPQSTHWCDVAVMDTGAPTYLRMTPLAALKQAELKKYRKYESRLGTESFSPLVMSVYGTLGPSALSVARRIARTVDPSCEPDDPALELHYCAVQVAALQAVSWCLRGRHLRPSRRARARELVNVFHEAQVSDAVFAPSLEMMSPAPFSGTSSFPLPGSPPMTASAV